MTKLLVILSLVISTVYGANLTVHVDEPAHEISPELFGIFVEEINHALDGGECIVTKYVTLQLSGTSFVSNL